MALIEECANLNFTHWSAHGGQVKEAAFEGSRELPALPPKRRKLYPMSSLELDELHSQIKMLLESGCIVPSLSDYGTPVLFAEKKGGGGLRMCTDYRSLNANTVTDSWSLLRIDEMLSRLKGAKYFSKLDLHDEYH